MSTDGNVTDDAIAALAADRETARTVADATRAEADAAKLKGDEDRSIIDAALRSAEARATAAEQAEAKAVADRDAAETKAAALAAMPKVQSVDEIADQWRARNQGFGFGPVGVPTNIAPPLPVPTEPPPKPPTTLDEIAAAYQANQPAGAFGWGPKPPVSPAAGGTQQQQQQPAPPPGSMEEFVQQKANAGQTGFGWGAKKKS